MNEEMKVRSFRMTDEIADKFRKICSDFPNQNTALESLINAYEVQTATAVLTDRQAEITDYSSHIQALQSAFLRSLEFAENAEQRIRSEFHLSLVSKDKMIQDLQNRTEKAERTAELAEKKVKGIEHDMSLLEDKAEIELKRVNVELQETKKALAQAEKQLIEKQSQIDDKQSLLESTRKQLENALQSAEKVVELELRAEELKAVQSENSRLQEETARIKADYESRMNMLQAQLDVKKQQAILTEQQKIADLKSFHAEEIKKLYVEIDNLRQKITHRERESAANEQ